MKPEFTDIYDSTTTRFDFCWYEARRACILGVAEEVNGA
jgi:hypothetical protein